MGAIDGKSLCEVNHDNLGSLDPNFNFRLYGSYDGLEIGHAADVFTDFSGGITLNFTNLEKDMFEIMRKSMQKFCWMACLRKIENKNDPKCQVYVINNVERVKSDDTTFHLVRLKNTNGIEELKEWNEQSSKLTKIVKAYKRLDCSSEDGEFWMKFEDFQKNFHVMQILYINQESKLVKLNWHNFSFESAWKIGITSGGANREGKSYAANPQFVLRLKQEQESTLIVSILQRYKRIREQQFLSVGVDFYTIGDDLNGKRIKLLKEKFTHNPIVQTELSDSKQVSKRIILKSGCYLLIPIMNDVHREFLFFAVNFFCSTFPPPVFSCCILYLI